MKRNHFLRILTSVALASLMMILAALPAFALTPHEQAWLSRLRPASLPKPNGATSFPAELQFAVTGQTPVTLKGKCSLEGELTDEELLDAIKKAAAEHDEYKSADDASDDAVTVEKLSGKLKFSPEDQKRIVSNWLSLAGVDKIVALLGGKIPDYGKADVVGVVTEMILKGDVIKGLKTLNPKPSAPGVGTVISGAFITWDEFKRDQERFQDIVELANARARLRRYNTILNRLLKEQMKDRTAWVIRIEDQVSVSQNYRKSPDIDVPYIYTSETVLKKKDGNMENPVGVYEGEFKLKVDLELSDYDANFHKYLAEQLNDVLRKAGYSATSALWKPVSQTVNHPSVNEMTLKGENVYVSLENGLGQVYEMTLDPWKLDVTRYKVLHDMVSVIRKENDAVSETLTWTEIHDSESRTAYHQDYTVIVNKLTGEKSETTNTDDDPYADGDMRGLIGVRLIVDLSSGLVG